jgi:hypothetical protein
MVSDGAFAAGGFVLTPYSGRQLTVKQQFFNFCFSSTRFYVEQTIGQWKNKFRVLLLQQALSFPLMCMVIYSTMILHNVCKGHNTTGDDVVDDEDAEYLEDISHPDDLPSDVKDQCAQSRMAVHNFIHGKNYPLPRCASCKAKNKIHCVHATRLPNGNLADAEADAMRDELCESMWVEHLLANNGQAPTLPEKYSDLYQTVGPMG